MNSITEYYTVGITERQAIFFSWYVHTLLFLTTGKPVLDVITLSFSSNIAR